MRSLLILPCAVAAFLASGCSVVDFEIEQQTDEVVLQGNLQAFQSGLRVPTDIIPSQSWDITLPQEPSAIYAERMTLSLTDTIPSARSMTIPFSFIDSLEFWIRSTKVDTKLAAQKIAWTGPPPAGDEFDLQMNLGLDLVPFIKEGFEVTATLNGRVPAANLSFIGRIWLGVDVF